MAKLADIAQASADGKKKLTLTQEEWDELVADVDEKHGRTFVIDPSAPVFGVTIAIKKGKK